MELAKGVEMNMKIDPSVEGTIKESEIVSARIGSDWTRIGNRVN